jgi:predicted metal-dependent RNase
VQIYGDRGSTFHDLRHDGVSRLFEMNWDIPRVASVSGHRDWNSLRRYTHPRCRGDIIRYGHGSKGSCNKLSSVRVRLVQGLRVMDYVY